MHLQQLANLEHQRIEDELNEKFTLIKDLEAILACAEKNFGKRQTRNPGNSKSKYGDARRTQIAAHGVKEFSIEDLVPNEAAIIMATRDGYIKRLLPDTFRHGSARRQRRHRALPPKKKMWWNTLFITTTHVNIYYFFTDAWLVFQLKAYDIPRRLRAPPKARR